MGRPKKILEPVTPFDDETVVTAGPPADAPVIDYLDIQNPDHANLTYAELQALAQANKQ